MASYTKLKAEQIFTGNEMLGDDVVLVMTDNGIVQDLVATTDAGDDVQVIPGMITPGFINCHCHIELSIFRDKIPRDTGMVDFIKHVFALRPLLASPESLQEMEKAIAGMIAEGIAGVGDISNTALSIPVKPGRKISFRNFVEVSGFVLSTANERFREGAAIAEKYRQAGLDAVVVPHAPYSVSEDLLRLVNESTTGKIISIHNQESATENEFFLQKKGSFCSLYESLGIDISTFTAPATRSLPYWLNQFKNQQKIISVHNSFINTDDLDYAESYSKAHGLHLYYCLCPKANQFIENTLPPVDLLRRKNANIVLGTDSLASNDSLSIWQEIQVIKKHFPVVPLGEILQWATLNGAKALGFDDRLGSLEKGKSPGLVQIHENTARKLL